MSKLYLGDGVYVSTLEDCDGVVLTTENGIGCTNRIVLEYDLCNELLRYLEVFIGRSDPPHQTGCICADCSGAELTADND